MPEFIYEPPMSLGPDSTRYRLLTSEYVSVVSFDGQDVLKVAPEALTAAGTRSVSRRLIPLPGVAPRESRGDPRRSRSPRPMTAASPWRCSRTPSWPPVASCRCARTPARPRSSPRKGQRVWTGVRDEEWLARGIFETYQKENLRYSQTMPLSMYEEVNSGTNLPAQIDISATAGYIRVPCSSPREAGRPTSRCCSRRPRPCSIRRALRHSSTRSCARSARPLARRITWRSSSAELRPRRR